MEPFVIKLIGFAAATCTTVAYAPQAIKVWKTRSTGGPVPAGAATSTTT